METRIIFHFAESIWPRLFKLAEIFFVFHSLYIFMSITTSLIRGWRGREKRRQLHLNHVTAWYTHTLLFLHVGEVFKREGPHRRSPEGIGLHDGLQASSDKENKTDAVLQSAARDACWPDDMNTQRQSRGRWKWLCPYLGLLSADHTVTFTLFWSAGLIC